MKHKSLSILSILFIITLILPSCFPDPAASKTLTGNDLVGEWKVKSATRDGKKTALLDGFYFNFTDATSLTTNFGMDGQEKSYTCKLDNGTLTCNGNGTLQLDVEQELEGEMVFSTKLAGKKFRITIEQSTTEE